MNAYEEELLGTITILRGKNKALNEENRELIVTHDKMARRLAEAEAELGELRKFITNWLDETAALNG